MIYVIIITENRTACRKHVKGFASAGDIPTWSSLLLRYVDDPLSSVVEGKIIPALVNIDGAKSSV